MLKCCRLRLRNIAASGFSALQRAEIAEIERRVFEYVATLSEVSVLFNEPKLLKFTHIVNLLKTTKVSVLFNEPKLLKCRSPTPRALRAWVSVLFNEPKLLKSTRRRLARRGRVCFSALQRAEIAEMVWEQVRRTLRARFSSLQRAEIAEMLLVCSATARWSAVSVLFNEPKLLKSRASQARGYLILQFQCSSTSRNC